MLQNAYLFAKIGANTAENEQHFTEILPKTGNYLRVLPEPPAGPLHALRVRPGEHDLDAHAAGGVLRDYLRGG